MQHRTSTAFSEPANFLPQPSDFPISKCQYTPEAQSALYKAETIAGKASLLSTLFVQLFGYRAKYLNHALWSEAWQIFSTNPPAEFTSWYTDEIVEIHEDDSMNLNTFIDLVSERLLMNFDEIDREGYRRLERLVRETYFMIFSAALMRFKTEPGQWYHGPKSTAILYFVETVNNRKFYDFDDLTRCLEEPELFVPKPSGEEEEPWQWPRCALHIPVMLEFKPGLAHFPLQFEGCTAKEVDEMYLKATKNGRANLLASLYLGLTGFKNQIFAYALWNEAYDMFLVNQPETFTQWGEREQIHECDSFVDAIARTTTARFYSFMKNDPSAWDSFYIMTWQYYELVFGAAYCHYRKRQQVPEIWFKQCTNLLCVYDFEDLTRTNRILETLPGNKQSNRSRDASPVRQKK